MLALYFIEFCSSIYDLRPCQKDDAHRLNDADSNLNDFDCLPCLSEPYRNMSIDPSIKASRCRKPEANAKDASECAARLCRKLIPLSGGRSIACIEGGNGPPIVLLHGMLMTMEDMWLPLADRLREHHRVIAFDLPGHGLSVRHRIVDASPWQQVTLIREALDKLCVEHPVIIGHSFGATVALCYACRYDDTLGVVAIAPLCYPEPRVEQLLFGLRLLPGGGDVLTQVLALATDPLLLPLLWQIIFLPQIMPAAFAKRFPIAHASGADRMTALGEDAMSLWLALAFAGLSYPRCRVPVHMIGGTADIVVNNALNGLLASFAMPRASFEWVVGAGHMLHHFHQERIENAVRAFFSA